MLKENVAIRMYINFTKAIRQQGHERCEKNVVQAVSVLVCDWLQYLTPFLLIETTNRDFWMSFSRLVLIG